MSDEKETNNGLQSVLNKLVPTILGAMLLIGVPMVIRTQAQLEDVQEDVTRISEDGDGDLDELRRDIRTMSVKIGELAVKIESINRFQRESNEDLKERIEILREEILRSQR